MHQSRVHISDNTENFTSDDQLTNLINLCGFEDDLEICLEAIVSGSCSVLPRFTDYPVVPVYYPILVLVRIR